jgi:predicted transport protein
MPRRTYWLRKLENYNRKERVEIDEYTIEHIMPQNPNLSKEWKRELGSDWERVHETWLHTLGNLTLTGYNSEYSDRPFLEKRDMENGFKDSPIKLNHSLINIDIWNEESIIERSKVLSEVALKVWKYPKLSNEVIDLYRPIAKEKNGYTIDDHPFLSSNNTSYVKKTRNLFDALRKEVLALDPVVVEEYLKLYIAFKAETNFLDVVPQAKRLRLSLNMPFSEISDPKGLCENVADVGRWGNGEVQVGFTDIEELPYIMSLVRQSFERQMNNKNDSE